MSDNINVLDDFFADAMTEVINIGMGSAAASLSEMINDEVILSVPAIEFVSRLKATSLIGEKAKTDVSGVHQNFNGVLDGDAILLFPEEQSLQLVCAVLLQNNINLADLTDMEQEAMTEIGNIILNACLCSMADMFNEELQSEVPQFIRGTLRQIFSANGGVENTESVVLLLNMDFAIESKSIQGYVTFLMDIKSVLKFKKAIENMLNI